MRAWMQSVGGPRRTRPVAHALLFAAVLGGTAALPAAACAQERTTLIRVLESARDFRARVRAALALGSTHDHSALEPLATALEEDGEAAVRAACASALGTLGDSGALPALRGALTDASSEVREAVEDAIRMLAIPGAGSSSSGGSGSSGGTASSGGSGSGASSGSSGSGSGRIDWGSARWFVVVGSMENRSSFTDDRLASVLEHEVHGGFIVLRGVAIVDDEVPHADALAEADRRDLPALRVEGSIATVERTRGEDEIDVSCSVSVLVMDEPGRSLRATLTASATATEELEAAAARTAQERRLVEAACEAAADRAMGGAARVLASAH